MRTQNEDRRFAGHEVSTRHALIYALLIYSNSSDANPVAPQTEEAGLEAHRALQAATSSANALLDVAKLSGKSQAKTVRMQGGGHTVNDGPFMEAKEWLVGFYLVECEDEARALEHAKQLVTAQRWCVEVRPVQWRRNG